MSTTYTTDFNLWVQQTAQLLRERRWHDMVHDLSRRLDALWRYDQYIANAEGYESVQTFWRKVKEQEKENIVELKKLLSEHIRLGDF